jgi:hypothetical protein
LFTQYQKNSQMTQGGLNYRIATSERCKVDNSQWGYELFQYFTAEDYSSHDSIWSRNYDSPSMGFTLTNSKCKQNRAVKGGTVRIAYMIASKFNKTFRYPDSMAMCLAKIGGLFALFRIFSLAMQFAH